MATHSITLHLPDAIMRQARQAADALHRPVEEVLADVLAATFPDVDAVPKDLQADLARMTWLDDQELWAIARSTLSEEQEKRLHALRDSQGRRPLTPEEQEALQALRREYGRVTVRKARAYALLSLRGGHLLLADG
ncbi:MAG: hypothetical protein HY331_17495 [Chloroflexi bacterium]|nr:hypothetical protein [Chloroflexota bacterium]